MWDLELKSTSLKKVQTFVNGCLRRILRIFWPERIRNEELWNRAGQRPIREEITQRRWRWLGHTLRKPRNSITRQSLQWNPQGKRGRGRPRTTWRRNLEVEMKASGHSWRDITRMAQDRREWGTVVRGLYPLQGEWLWWWHFYTERHVFHDPFDFSMEDTKFYLIYHFCYDS